MRFHEEYNILFLLKKDKHVKTILRIRQNIFHKQKCPRRDNCRNRHTDLILTDGRTDKVICRGSFAPKVVIVCQLFQTPTVTSYQYLRNTFQYPFFQLSASWSWSALLPPSSVSTTRESFTPASTGRFIDLSMYPSSYVYQCI